VASFARFTLQMMSFGAPAELIREIQLAAADEVKHAQRAAEILSALSGEPISPGAFSLENLTLTTSRAHLVEMLIREACVGETLGVAEITAALKVCTQEEVRVHLAEVLQDETRHAGLAWRSLRWLLESAPRHEQGPLLRLIKKTFRQCSVDMGLTGHQTSHLQVTSEPALNRWGVLSSSQTHLARLTAYQHVLLPCLSVLESHCTVA